MTAATKPAKRALLPRRVRDLLRLRFVTAGRVSAVATVLGLVGLSYVSGAGVMFFGLPSSDYLGSAFRGGRAWYDRTQAPPRPADPTAAYVSVDCPYRTCDGYTLYTTTQGSRATLLDMGGNVVHEWQLPFSRAWPKPAHVRNPFADERIHWFRCHAYANGDLLAVYHADNDTPYGYGLAKMDKDSNVLWTYDANAHHDLDVDADGRIYTLTQKIVSEPPAGMSALAVPYIADYLSVLSPEGRELIEPIPLVEAFRDSPYAQLLALSAKRKPDGPGPAVTFATLGDAGDVLHANSVRVVRQAPTANGPTIKPGQVVISLRTLHSVAVVDTNSRTVVWATAGLWRNQHDAEFLENGHLLLYDNTGSLSGPRVLEYDPVTQAYPWFSGGESPDGLGGLARGMKQRLANGNTLIVDPDGGRLLEVTGDHNLVWECACTQPLTFRTGARRVCITGARRYAAAELPFLSGGPRVRP
jgi:Arylsulfotransferase (ASST)